MNHFFYLNEFRSKVALNILHPGMISETFDRKVTWFITMYLKFHKCLYYVPLNFISVYTPCLYHLWLVPEATKRTQAYVHYFLSIEMPGTTWLFGRFNLTIIRDLLQILCYLSA